MGKLDEVIKGLDNMANGEKAFDEDNINHPKHYETDKVECIEAMEITQGRGAVMSFCLCNAFKYLWRHGRKNGVEDIKKARWYLDKYIELAEEDKKEKQKDHLDEFVKFKLLADDPPLDPIIKAMDASKEEKEKLYNDMLRRGPTIDPAVLEDLFDADYGNGVNA